MKKWLKNTLKILAIPAFFGVTCNNSGDFVPLLNEKVGTSGGVVVGAVNDYDENSRFFGGNVSFASLKKGEFYGVGFSGIASINSGTFYGIDSGSFVAGTSEGVSTGISVAGFTAYDSDSKMRGGSLGLVNVLGDNAEYTGLRVGVVNNSVDSSRIGGLDIALGNVESGQYFNGVQLGGYNQVDADDVLCALQIGLGNRLVSHKDSIKGPSVDNIQVGLFNTANLEDLSSVEENDIFQLGLINRLVTPEGETKWSLVIPRYFKVDKD